MPLLLPRLLILAALLILAVAVPTTRASAQVTCPCWPDGPPLVDPVVFYQSSTSQLNTFAFLPPANFIQVTNGWCRQNGLFRQVTPEEAQLCAQQLQCLSAATDLRPDELCNGLDDNCDGFVDEGFPLDQFCEDGLGDCRQTGGLICDPNDATATICDATALDPTEPGTELTCTGGSDEDCDGQADCADLDCEWNSDKLPDLTCKDPVCGDSITDVDEQCDGGPCCTGCILEPSGTVCGIDEMCQAETCTAAGDCVLETFGGTCDVDPDGPNDACDTADDVCQAGVCTNTDPVAMPEVLCNNIDDDCNGSTPDTPSGSCAANASGECGNGTLACGAGGVTCQPGSPAPELCNGLDDDCNGLADVSGAGSESDGDGDGQWECQGDCDDGNAARFTGNSEICDGIDNDCNGLDDVLGFAASETDNDGDFFSECAGDCNDGNSSVFPGAPESCGNGVDDDCDGAIDCNDSSCAGTTACVVCGDGNTQGSEQCDDGNTNSGDGCSSTCQTEAPQPTPGCSCTGTNNCANAGSPGTVCCQRRVNPQNFSCIGVSLSVGGCFDGNPPGEPNFEERCIP